MIDPTNAARPFQTWNTFPWNHAEKILDLVLQRVPQVTNKNTRKNLQEMWEWAIEDKGYLFKKIQQKFFLPRNFLHTTVAIIPLSC